MEKETKGTPLQNEPPRETEKIEGELPATQAEMTDAPPSPAEECQPAAATEPAAESAENAAAAEPAEPAAEDAATEPAAAIDPDADLDPPDHGTSAEFIERYQRAKDKEMDRLSQEIDARKGLDTKKKRIMWWVKTCALLLIIGLSIFLMFELPNLLTENGNTVSFTTMVSGIKWEWFAGLVCILLAFMMFESARYGCLLKVSTGKFRARVSIKTMFLGKYYDGVTPLGTGGQPFQIYYLHKKKIPAGAATAIPLVKYIVGTVVFCMMAIVLMSISPRFFTAQDNQTVTLSVRIIAWISMAVNLVVPLIMLIVSCFPRFGKKMIVWIVKLLSKLHIVKHRYAVTKKYVYEIGEYRNSVKFLIKRWWKLIPLVIVSILAELAHLIIPFFVVVAIAPDVTASWDLLLHIMCLGIISFYAASLIPTPGNTGASEVSSSIVFLSVAGLGNYLGWTILVWRFSTYYIFILSGIGINIFEIIRSSVRARRAAKRLQ